MARPQHKRVAGIWHRQCYGPLHNKAFIPLDEFNKKRTTEWNKWCRNCLTYENTRKKKYRRPLNDFKPEEEWITNSSDPLVVPTGVLSEYLQEWSSKPGNTMEKLSELTDVGERRLTAIMLNETQYTNLRIVDKILAMNDDNYLLHFQLAPIPNPRWSQERWEEYRRQHGVCEP